MNGNGERKAGYHLPGIRALTNNEPPLSSARPPQNMMHSQHQQAPYDYGQDPQGAPPRGYPGPPHYSAPQTPMAYQQPVLAYQQREPQVSSGYQQTTGRQYQGGTERSYERDRMQVDTGMLHSQPKPYYYQQQQQQQQPPHPRSNSSGYSQYLPPPPPPLSYPAGNSSQAHPRTGGHVPGGFTGRADRMDTSPTSQYPPTYGPQYYSGAPHQMSPHEQAPQYQAMSGPGYPEYTQHSPTVMQEPRGAMVAAGPIRGSAPPVHGPAPSHTTQQHNSLVQRPPARPLQPPAPQPPAPQPPAPQPPASLPAHRAHARMGSGGSIPAGHSASQQPTAQPAVPAAPAVSSRGGRHDRSRQTQTPDGTANPELLDDEAREAHEALMKRRKRNAQSAARLRERRKNREQELFSSCQRLESQILQLEEELADEKQRAIKDIRRREPDPAAIEDNLQAGGIPETRQEKTNKRQRTDDGEAGGKRTRPMRELDQVRLDDLRSKIATLGKLNQQVCVNLGVLRQEIRRISQTIITQKDGQQSATAA